MNKEFEGKYAAVTGGAGGRSKLQKHLQKKDWLVCVVFS